MQRLTGPSVGDIESELRSKRWTQKFIPRTLYFDFVVTLLSREHRA
jgi:hypothetical protein